MIQDANCHTQLCLSTGLISELTNINRKNKPRLPNRIPCHVLSESILVLNLQLYVLSIEKSHLKSSKRLVNRSVSFLTGIFLSRLSRLCAVRKRESFFAA